MRCLSSTFNLVVVYRFFCYFHPFILPQYKFVHFWCTRWDILSLKIFKKVFIKCLVCFSVLTSPTKQTYCPALVRHLFPSFCSLSGIFVIYLSLGLGLFSLFLNFLMYTEMIHKLRNKRSLSGFRKFVLCLSLLSEEQVLYQQRCMVICSKVICSNPVSADPLNFGHLQQNHLQQSFAATICSKNRTCF